GGHTTLRGNDVLDAPHPILNRSVAVQRLSMTIVRRSASHAFLDAPRPILNALERENDRCLV
ncbi:hypothetical protein, partial [Pseudomonas syringae group genomosp. 3]|uniref:hypothetical protein n=1 Tax=Pseudomonas syringae group genomosp. 3 TaxID=251701 RepID=UPI001C824972